LGVACPRGCDAPSQPQSWLRGKIFDFAAVPEQTSSRMNASAENFYAVWRESCRAVSRFQDENGVPPEKLLQTVWQHQRLRRDQLQTADGRAVRVLHPGWQSVTGGPDFRGAVLQIGGEPAVSGEVEVDLEPGGWRQHGHDRNPAFAGVILQVVWAAGKIPAGQPPVLPLRDFLDSPLPSLARELENEAGLPAALRGQCAAPLRELDAASLAELLGAAARVRFQNKAAAILARARHSGWEQALWEHLFRGLGYRHNVWPMVHLAETKARWLAGAESATAIQSRLLGVSGLLPAELTRSQRNSDTYLRRAWDVWWRERDGLAGCTLPRQTWKFHGLRPANHPQRRLALAAHWLAEGRLVADLEDWCAADIPERRLALSLGEVLATEPDDFWSWHWTFNSTRLPQAQPLLGAARVTDLAVNVVLPWLWVRAREGGNTRLQREMERRFQAWPAGEDNAVLKLARQRLLGTGSGKILKSAAQQQGLMQIVRDFCEHSNAICADCRFPDLVRSWRVTPGGKPL